MGIWLCWSWVGFYHVSPSSEASLLAQLVKNPLAMQETPVFFLGQEVPLERSRLPTPIFLGFLGDSGGKESVLNVGDLDVIPGLGRYPGRGHGNPLQYSCLKNHHSQRSLEGYGPWDCKRSDMTERLSTAQDPSSKNPVILFYRLRSCQICFILKPDHFVFLTITETLKDLLLYGLYQSKINISKNLKYSLICLKAEFLCVHVKNIILMKNNYIFQNKQNYWEE